MMKMIFLSPHLDDSAYSCGGLIWEKIRDGVSVEIWTIFSGIPPLDNLPPYASQLHLRWGLSEVNRTLRNMEDLKACAILGCTWRHFGYPDCIYRTLPGSSNPLIKEDADLFQPVRVVEFPLVLEVAGRVKEQLQPGDQLVAPLAIGGHVDHRIVRNAAESLDFNLSYYPDFPYAALEPASAKDCVPPGCTESIIKLSTRGLKKWQQAVAAYASQVSSFWPSADALNGSVKVYANSSAGCRLWTRASG
jgi:LmbE family N-acetylglucosaminyl deacetylase